MDPFFIVQVTPEVGLSGGTECVAFELHRAWLARGLDARVVASKSTEPEAQEGVKLIASWLSGWNLVARSRYLTPLLTIPLFTLLATFSVWRMRGTKLIVSHGDSLMGDVCVMHAVNSASLAEKRRAGYYGWMLNPINLWVALRDRWMLGGARYRRIVAISERVRRQLKQYHHVPDERIVRIPNGINLARFTPANAQSRAEVRRSIGIAPDVPLVLFVGNQYRLKGLEFAIKALVEMETKAVLLVVGGDTTARFKRMAQELGVGDRVIFAGVRSDLPTIYPVSDAFVFPSLYETFALVCLEAMASGLPVLAAPVGGIEDYLLDGVNGFHIQRDARDIAAKLDRVLTDPELHARIRKAGLETAANYSWEKIAGQYLALFEELTAEKARVSTGLGSSGSSISF